RHHEGWTRQRSVRRIVGAPLPWVVPFVVALVGEYVIEIVEDVARGLPEVGRAGSAQQQAYGAFLAANPELLRLTQARVVSYWDCYYRRDYPRIHDYPGHRLAAALTQAATITAQPDI